jgi:hypothetical protein
MYIRTQGWRYPAASRVGSRLRSGQLVGPYIPTDQELVQSSDSLGSLERLPSAQATPKEGRFYQIKKGDNLLKVTSAAYSVPPGQERLKLARLINDHPWNQRYRHPKPVELFPEGIISFYPKFECSAARQISAKGKPPPGKCYAVIFIPERGGKPKSVCPPRVEKSSKLSMESATISPLPPSPRPCCILAPHLGLGSNLVKNPDMLGKHRGKDEVSGIVYTTKAGFLDLGHIRDLCDLTKYIFDQISSLQGTPERISTNEGCAVFRMCPEKHLWVELARAIAYDDGLAHEIATFEDPRPGGHNSSFSPEDLCSNFLGTLLAEKAIHAGGDFDTSVTRELKKLLSDLGGQPEQRTREAFDRINHRWVEFTDARSLLGKNYLKRRNFTMFPWKAGLPIDKPTPSIVTTNFNPRLRAIYTFVRSSCKILELDPTITGLSKAPFFAEIAEIKKKARKEFGKNFDRP